MSTETLSWVRDYLSKVAAHDVEGASNYLADDLVAHLLGRSKLAGDFSRDGLQEVMREMFGALDVKIEPIEVMAGEDHAVAVVRSTVDVAGTTYEGLRTVLYRLSDGQIHEIWTFDEDQRAYDAAVDAGLG